MTGRQDDSSRDVIAVPSGPEPQMPEDHHGGKSIIDAHNDPMFETKPSTDQKAPPLTVPRDSARRLILVTLLLAAVAATLSLSSIVNATRFSALDENTHLDYAYQIAHGVLPYMGQPESAYTVNSWACRSQAGLPTLPRCNSGLPDSAYPGGAVQYNGFHPPLYYALTGPTARVLAAITGQDFMTMARALGALWLFAGMLAMYLTLRYWRIDWDYALGGALLISLFPCVVEASSTVTNDAPAMLCGVAALFILGRTVVYQRTGWVLPVVFMVLSTATKSINSVALLAVAATLLCLGLTRWRSGDRVKGRTWIRNAVFMGLAFAIINFGWQFLAKRRTLPGFVNPIAGVHVGKVRGLPIDEWLPSLVDGTRLGANYYLDPAVNGRYILSWSIMLSTLTAAAALVGLGMFRRLQPGRYAAGCLLVGLILYPLFVQLQAFLNGDYFPQISDRYGMSLIPIAVAVLVLITEKRRLRKTAITILIAGGVAVLTATLGMQS